MPRLTRLSIPWRELPLLTVGECAEVLGVHRSVVDALVADGTLTTRSIGAQWRVETASLVAWVDGERRERGSRRAASAEVQRAARAIGLRGVR